MAQRVLTKGGSDPLAPPRKVARADSTSSFGVSPPFVLEPDIVYDAVHHAHDCDTSLTAVAAGR